MNTISDIRESEVLKIKIDIDEKHHEAEKKKLENVINVLKDSATDQTDKIIELNESNLNKGKTIDQMREKEEKMVMMKEELLGKISFLEEHIRFSSETCEKQQNEIKRLRGELSRVENELQIMKKDKSMQENALNGIRAEIKQQSSEVNKKLNTITKQMEIQSKESAKKLADMAVMLENILVAKDSERSVNIQTAQHVTLSLNQRGGRTRMCAERKAVPVRIFSPQLRSTGKVASSPSKRPPLNRKNQRKAE